MDLAENLLELARPKARARGLQNVAFRQGDMLDLGLPEAGFDAVVCVFGIFFVPDMAAALRELWRHVRPGGQLAVTTWGPRFFEPVNTAFWDAVGAVEPTLYKAFNPWDLVSEPEMVRSLFDRAGIEPPTVVSEAGSQPLHAPEDWWPMVLGSGYRGTLERLDSQGRDRVRNDCLGFIRAREVSSLEANVVYAVATK